MFKTTQSYAHLKKNNCYNQCHSSLYEQNQAYLYTFVLWHIRHVANEKQKLWNIMIFQIQVKFQNFKWILYFKSLNGFEFAAPLHNPFFNAILSAVIEAPKSSLHLALMCCIWTLFSLTAFMPSFQSQVWSDKHK